MNEQTTELSRPYVVPDAQFLPTAAAARWLGRTPEALRQLRKKRRGPRCFRAEDGLVMYPVVDLVAYVDAQMEADPFYNPDNDPTRTALRPKRNRAGRRVAEQEAA